MTADRPARRQFLVRSGTALAAASVSGCVGALDGSSDGGNSGDDGDCEDDRVVLGAPEGEAEVPVDDPPFPEYGEPIPEVTAPAPLHDREVTTTEFVCDRHQLYTFVFARCHEACPNLVGVLRQVQADAIERGYADEVAFIPITFDPENDTPDVLAEFTDSLGVNRGHDHWFTLRPETPERAKEVVHRQFGQEFSAVGGGNHDEGEGDGDRDENDEFDLDDLEGAGEEVTGSDEEDEDGHVMPFMHVSLILLANRAGVVERAYSFDVPTPTTLVDDVHDLVETW